jgi:hypothetical protein
VRVVAGLILLALLNGCTSPTEPEAIPEPKPSGPSAPFERFGLEHLPDDRLEAAIPDGFELGIIKRNPTEFRRKGWVTVGVRLRPEEVYYARAIFYVLGSRAKARKMFERQSQLTRQQYSFLKTGRFIRGPVPKPFEVTGVRGENLCGVRAEALYWCHAWGGRLYLLTQSSTGVDGDRRVTPGTEIQAEMLLRAFAALLDTEG